MTHESLHTSPTVSGRTTLPPFSTDPGSGISSRDPPQGGMTGGGTGGAGKGAALATPAPQAENNQAQASANHPFGGTAPQLHRTPRDLGGRGLPTTLCFVGGQRAHSLIPGVCSQPRLSRRIEMVAKGASRDRAGKRSLTRSRFDLLNRCPTRRGPLVRRCSSAHRQPSRPGRRSRRTPGGSIVRVRPAPAASRHILLTFTKPPARHLCEPGRGLTRAVAGCAPGGAPSGAERPY